jgi:hypothetical protein
MIRAQAARSARDDEMRPIPRKVPPTPAKTIAAMLIHTLAQKPPDSCRNCGSPVSNCEERAPRSLSTSGRPLP